MKNKFPSRGVQPYYAHFRAWAAEIEAELNDAKKRIAKLEAEKKAANARKAEEKKPVETFTDSPEA